MRLGWQDSAIRSVAVCVSGKVILTDTTPDLHGSDRPVLFVEWALAGGLVGALFDGGGGRCDVRAAAVSCFAHALTIR
jgi:hypothetical protein